MFIVYYFLGSALMCFELCLKLLDTDNKGNLRIKTEGLQSIQYY